jgi:hypothetical protein
MTQELKRLMVLKSYWILDAEREEEFERITRIATLMFVAAMSSISVIDLGRVWLVASQGVPAEIKDTTR